MIFTSAMIKLLFSSSAFLFNSLCVNEVLFKHLLFKHLLFKLGELLVFRIPQMAGHH